MFIQYEIKKLLTFKMGINRNTNHPVKCIVRLLIAFDRILLLLRKYAKDELQFKNGKNGKKPIN